MPGNSKNVDEMLMVGVLTYSYVFQLSLSWVSLNLKIVETLNIRT